jgi:hypothetical protein
MNANKRQHLLGVAAQVVRAISRAAIRACQHLGNLLGRNRRRHVLRHRVAATHDQTQANGACEEKVLSSHSHGLVPRHRV